jgi:hypothetical protein
MAQAKQMEQFIKQVVGNSLQSATIKRIYGNTISVQVGGSSRWMRNIQVIGGTSGLLVGDEVVLASLDGAVVAQRYVRS